MNSLELLKALGSIHAARTEITKSIKIALGREANLDELRRQTLSRLPDLKHLINFGFPVAYDAYPQILLPILAMVVGEQIEKPSFTYASDMALLVNHQEDQIQTLQRLMIRYIDDKLTYMVVDVYSDPITPIHIQEGSQVITNTASTHSSRILHFLNWLSQTFAPENEVEVLGYLRIDEPPR
jgi:hypothetical protein